MDITDDKLVIHPLARPRMDVGCHFMNVQDVMQPHHMVHGEVSQVIRVISAGRFRIHGIIPGVVQTPVTHMNSVVQTGTMGTRPVLPVVAHSVEQFMAFNPHPTQAVPVAHLAVFPPIQRAQMVPEHLN